MVGIILRWRIPDTSQVSYDKVYIYYSTSQSGAYSELANQAVTDNTYFHLAGSSTLWYKIRFYDSVNLGWSDWSAPMQGGDFYGYCCADDVRLLAGVPTAVTDSQIYDLMFYAQAQLNRDIGIEWRDEEVLPIDNEKENEIDGVNTTYYVRRPWIGDYNDDGRVTTADISAYRIDGESVRYAVSIASIADAEIGKFTVTTAVPNGSNFFVRYRTFPVCVDPPNRLIRMACAYLTAAYSYSKQDIRQAQSFRVGKVAVTRQAPAYDKLLGMYNRTLYAIKNAAVTMKTPDREDFIPKSSSPATGDNAIPDWSR